MEWTSKERRTVQELVQIVKEHVCAPIEKVIYTNTWTSDKELLCFFKVKSDILRMSVSDIYNMCTTAKHVYFGSYLTKI